jgi:CRP-like cAMP-binding protein
MSIVIFRLCPRPQLWGLPNIKRMSTYLNIMSSLSRLDGEEIHVSEPLFVLEKGHVPHGVLMVMSGKLQLLPGPDKDELPQAPPRRIWAVKEVWSESAYPFWLRALPGTVLRVIPRAHFLKVLREEPQLRLEVLRLLSSELGLVGGQVTA